MICDDELRLFDLNDSATIGLLERLIDLSTSYAVIHQYLSFTLCITGVLMNSIHVIVLTRRKMRRNAVNRLLSAIAICDISTMLSYLLFIVRFGSPDKLSNPPAGYGYEWTLFLLVHVVMSIALHSITLYVTVAAAYIRYSSISSLNSKWRDRDVSRNVFLVITFFIVVLCVPTFLLHSIVEVPMPPGTNQSLYTITLSGYDSMNTCSLFKFNLWLTGIVFKVIPCVLLLVFTVALLRTLALNKKHRVLLLPLIRLSRPPPLQMGDRTTKILIILLSVFVCTELPQGVLAILNGLFPNDIHLFIYVNFGEVLDLLSLINCNTCFIVYALVSSRYRATLKQLWQKLLLGQKGLKDADTAPQLSPGACIFLNSTKYRTTVVGMTSV
ncbi:Protein DMSR-5 [Aphelenchoides avenae]|nr:Protein DMSR-5 [Aphelenchus avenae]